MSDISNKTLNAANAQALELTAKYEALISDLLAALRDCEKFLGRHADMNDLFHPETTTQQCLVKIRVAISQAEVR